MLYSNQGMPHARPDYFDLGRGVAVQFQPDAVPYIQWDHIDGPVLHSRNSTLDWLTLWERLQIRFGFADAYSLEHKHYPDFVRRWNARITAEKIISGALAKITPTTGGEHG